VIDEDACLRVARRCCQRSPRRTARRRVSVSQRRGAGKGLATEKASFLLAEFLVGENSAVAQYAEFA